MITRTIPFLCILSTVTPALAACGAFFEGEQEVEWEDQRGNGHCRDRYPHDTGVIPRRPDSGTIIDPPDAGELPAPEDAGEVPVPEDAGAPEDSGSTTCRRDSDCPADQICNHPLGRCEPPPVWCTDLRTEAECLARSDCQTIYAGMNCRDENGGECLPGDTDCTCEIYSFAACVSAAL